MAKSKIAIIMGSDSDLKVMNEAASILKEFTVPYEIKILSAHRTPKDTIRYVGGAKSKGIKVIIAGAGGAAHLAGLIAAHTLLPVIGVPMETAYLKGIDSLFSTVQMPSGVPVACMAIGSAGAKNASLFALEMLALSDSNIYRKLEQYRKRIAKSVREKNRR
jgi:5-(carboxyamino)imidazole ribonucleotide mutase